MNASDNLMYVFPNHHFHDHTEVHHNGNLINYLANWLLVVFHFSVLYLILQETFFYKFTSTFLIILNTFSLIISYYLVKVWELKKGIWSIFLNYSLRSVYYFTFPCTDVYSSHFSQDRKENVCSFILNPLHENCENY